ncbi:MarR family winged helix-turn-helix transcriptional regulator [Streptomyces sp. NPDC005408]|uniref:MarR family winged helix-turn-helix transcriptional regulator n=1 Tax=Streptomyces sp. NPDC005408 TaxID=3155341 RepID=UPI0033A5E856
MSTAPTLNGQVIGQAHYATRAVLESLLAPDGITFHQVLALNATADVGGGIERDALVGRMTGGLKIDESAVLATIASLAAAGLLEDLPGDVARVALTEEGRALHGRIRTGTAAITERLYGDLPAEDLATAGRVLTLVTARANAELADA